jgi:L-threonylcarbamoyladenylate synthase
VRTFLPTQLDEVAASLGAGNVIAIPTDTVYGLAASLRVPDAVRRLFVAKGRPESVPLPVLAASLDDVDQLVGRLDDASRRLGSTWWPGPLTLVVPGPHDLCGLIGASSDTVGLRIPRFALTQALLSLTGPLAVTSANLHGEPPCTTAFDVLDALAETHVHGVVDGGLCAGTPSSVVEIVDGELIVHRQGALSRDELLGSLPG